MNIPESYVIQKLHSYAHEPEYHRLSRQYTAGCPKCKEGKSLGRKKRLYYYTSSNTLYCFNCNQKWSAYSWLYEVCKLSKREIEAELASNNYRVDISDRINSIPKKNNQISTLPHDSINLCDLTQLSYYKDNAYIQLALKFLKDRKLDTAANRPEAFYISLTDFVHKNRICIPFYSELGDIVWYQTRCLDGSDPKYLNKANSDKRVFGLDRVCPTEDYIFIFEGPIDAMFVKNGVAVTGLNITSKQEEELNQFTFQKKIWVPDNQHIDKAAKEKTEDLLKNKSSVFIWPDNIKCKDFNELAILLNQNIISHKFILNHVK